VRLVRPLRQPAFALLWAGLAFSALGDQVYVVALAWLAVQAFGANAGLLSALTAACALTAALFAGRWVDHRVQPGVMVAADLARAGALVGAVAAWSALGPSPAALGLAVAVLGAGQSLFRPAMQAVLPVLVRSAPDLPAANALLDSTERMARLGGPALVGLLGGVVPPLQFLSLDALTFVGSAAAVVLAARMAALAGVRRAGTRDGVLEGLVRGFRTLRGHPLLYRATLVGFVSNGAWLATFYLALPLRLGSGRLGAYGAVMAAYGLGNLASMLVVGSRPATTRPGWVVLVADTCFSAGILLVGVAASLDGPALVPCLAAGAALTAASAPPADILLAVLRQTELPRADLPAAMRAVIAVAQGGFLVAMLAAPAALRAVAPGTFIAGCGAAGVVASVLGLGRFRR
jgi:hypothetical protein